MPITSNIAEELKNRATGNPNDPFYSIPELQPNTDAAKVGQQPGVQYTGLEDMTKPDTLTEGQQESGLLVPQIPDRDLYDPTKTQAPQVQVAPESTVAGQMTNLLDRENAYIRQARQRAMGQAASRGLLNTSIATGAGEQAAIQAALPIATQDAATFAQAASQNSQQATALLLEQLGIKGQLDAADLDAATKMMGIAMDNENKLLLTQITEDNKRALQSDASIATAYSNTMTSIAQVYQNPDMSAYQQEQAAEYFMSSFKSYVEFQDVAGGSNYADQFDWGHWDVTAAEQEAGTTITPQTAPFGDEGASHGEIRFHRGGGRVGSGQRYQWDDYQKRWNPLHGGIFGTDMGNRGNLFAQTQR